MMNFDKTMNLLQVFGAALFVLFALFNLVHTLVMNPDALLILVFYALLALSWKFLRISASELLEAKKGGKQ